MVSRRTIRSWIQGARHERRDGGICDFVCHPLPQQKVEKNFSGCSSIKENQGKMTNMKQILNKSSAHKE
jgi:hypothetical protein